MDRPQKADRSSRLRPSCAVGLLLIALAALFSSATPVRSDSSPTPIPTYDRLATPVMPENPTPSDLGQQVYYLHCMTCHGDVGQGLTEEWRNVWVDDHRNCWAKGCHGGRVEDQGFPLPKTIPAVIGPEANLAQHATSAELIAYLQQTHPPQRPGQLEKQEYEQVTAFLWRENHREVGTAAPAWVVIGTGGLGVAAIALLLYRVRRMRNRV